MRRISLLSFVMLACAALFSHSIAAQESSSQPSDDDCKGPVYKSSEVSNRALFISRPDPRLTEEARTRGISGRVVITAVLCRSGHVTDIKVLEGLPCGVTEQAVEAVRQAKFTPAVKDRQQVSQAIGFEFSFRYVGEPRPLATGPLDGRSIESIDLGGLPDELMDGIGERLETHVGDLYNEVQLAHDWQLLLQLADFDKEASTLRIEEGTRGGLGVVFDLKKRAKQ
jgi:TonB family protein